MSRTLIRCLLGFGLASTATLSGQDIDPYTRFDPVVMERLGYASSGPFVLGSEHGRHGVDAELGTGPVRWLETRHFRIGSTLVLRPLPPTSRERRSLYADCAELHRLLPRIPAEPDELDGWLQLHIYAFLLERLYAEFAAMTGVDAEWLEANAPGRQAGQRGQGPMLGCSGKFVVLLFEERAQLGRYLRYFCEARSGEPRRQYLPATDAMLLATSAESWDGGLRDPVQLRAHVIYETVQNFVDAFVGSSTTSPLWWRQGLAEGFVRSVDDRVCGRRAPFAGPAWRPEDWPVRLGARLRHEVLPGLEEVMHWHLEGRRAELDHAVTWSLADFLLRRDERGVARWLRFVRQHPMSNRMMPRQLVIAWHDHALRGAFGLDLARLRQEWHRHVTSQAR
ncbi:MAG: hypothetical protein VYE77_02925 [Planctomycetota bacterium]|nr:hypothetical protein [Planctomycetota bacterium]